jgi:peptidyl-dipeptidase A
MTSDLLLQQFLTHHLRVIEPLHRETAIASWEMQTLGSPEARERSLMLSSRFARVYANPEEYAFLRGLPQDRFDDPGLARQHTLLLNLYLANQMEERVIEEIIGREIEIEDCFNNHRAFVRGQALSDNEIDEILLTSNDIALRQETWEASKRVGAEIAERMKDLIRLRNRESRRLGFANYYSMMLTLQELDETRLFGLLEALGAQSDPIWQTYKSDLDRRLAARFQITLEALRPWHHSNRFFQEPEPGDADLDRFFADKNLEALTETFYQAIGLPIADLLQRADLYERAGKCQHAFCMDIDRAGDVRVLCNLRPNERWMETMLHEFGHAVYDKFHASSLPFLLREPAHTLTTEAVALLMGRFSKNARWLERYAGVAPEEAARIGQAAQRQLRNQLLVFMRWCLVMAHFERALYTDPEQDLNTLWWDLVEEFQKLVCPIGERPPDSWAAKIHIATSPVYYHNYQLGEMAASQILNHLETVVLKGEGPDALISSPKVGQWMKERLFYPGATRPWEAWLEHATGEPLNPAHFAQQLQG